jgi:exodeoxyribonuclease VII large subunit
MALLDSVSPLNTLKRGYAIATDADGNNLTRASQTLKDARVIVQLFEGQLDCRVERLIDGAIPFFDKDQ